jgi:hypothetical protein
MIRRNDGKQRKENGRMLLAKKRFGKWRNYVCMANLRRENWQTVDAANTGSPEAMSFL